MERTGRAVWIGSLHEGYGLVSTASGALTDLRHSFTSRFGLPSPSAEGRDASRDGSPHTNPDELVAAGIAACYTMAAAVVLRRRGASGSARLYGAASVQLSSETERVTGVNLRLWAEVPGYSSADVDQLAHEALEACIVGQMLGVPIRVEVMGDPVAVR